MQGKIVRHWTVHHLKACFLTILILLLGLAFPVLADYLGPDRTVSTWTWERLDCHYFASYDPPGPGYFGCHLDLYYPPNGGCPAPASTAPFFNPVACVGWTGSCTGWPCTITGDSAIVGCSEGQEGCRSNEHTSTYPPATISGSVGCTQMGSAGWCVGASSLALSASEPVAGYSITVIEGTRNGMTFACPGASCALDLAEGQNDFTFWALSTWGDSSLMGSSSGKLDTHPPLIDGSLTGADGLGGWFVSNVTLSASASDPAPGSGLASFELSLDGAAYAPYTGSVTLSDGVHSLALRAADSAGLTASQSVTAPIDTLPPVLSLNAAGSFCPGCGESLSISLDVQDAGSGIAAWGQSANGASLLSGSMAGSQAFSWDGSSLPAGVHTLRLQAQDTAGNAASVELDVTLILPTPTPLPPGVSAPPSSSPPDNNSAQEASNSSLATPSRMPIPGTTRTPTVVRTVVLPAILPATQAESGIIPQEESGESGFPAPAVLWGAVAAGAIGAATAYSLERQNKRKEEEARQRAEAEWANAKAEARDDALHQYQAYQAYVAAQKALEAQQEAQKTHQQMLHAATLPSDLEAVEVTMRDTETADRTEAERYAAYLQRRENPGSGRGETARDDAKMGSAVINKTPGVGTPLVPPQARGQPWWETLLDTIKTVIDKVVDVVDNIVTSIIPITSSAFDTTPTPIPNLPQHSPTPTMTSTMTALRTNTPIFTPTSVPPTLMWAAQADRIQGNLHEVGDMTVVSAYLKNKYPGLYPMFGDYPWWYVLIGDASKSAPIYQGRYANIPTNLDRLDIGLILYAMKELSGNVTTDPKHTELWMTSQGNRFWDYCGHGLCSVDENWTASPAYLNFLSYSQSIATGFSLTDNSLVFPEVNLDLIVDWEQKIRTGEIGRDTCHDPNQPYHVFNTTTDSAAWLKEYLNILQRQQTDYLRNIRDSPAFGLESHRTTGNQQVVYVYGTDPNRYSVIITQNQKLDLCGGNACFSPNLNQPDWLLSP